MSVNMRMFLLCCAAAVLCLTATGCWNRTELNELGITVATGFDRSGNDWEISYQIVVPSATGASQGGGTGGGSQPSVSVFTTKGKTIREAAALGYVENPRRLYFGHTEITVIGKEAAETGINQILDLYFRNVEARETVLVAVTDRKASDILRNMVPPEKIPGSALADIMRKQQNNSSYFPVINLFQLAQKISSDSRAAGVPVVSVPEGSEKPLESLDINKTTSPPVKMKIVRLGVFKGDRLAGWLNRAQSYGIAWLTDQVKGSTLSFACPGTETNGKNEGSLLINRAKTNVIPVKAGDHYKMKVNIQASGNLLEYMCGGDPFNPETIQAIEREVGATIIDTVNTGWEAAQKMRVDLPGFAGKIHRKDPETWKRIKGHWDEELAKIELEVHVTVKVERPGLLKKSFKQLSNKNGPHGG
ncbi:Ger(x)C family spore germination protein [Paenibacillus macerans]|uniref:Ger(x)C family spore germination protein n=1 Tax=Paenibacillus macerans TaxID=44252 RepID=UPI002DBD4CC3|nr:Ger(x)C family spore germination protein [Paenibacillus macerans]MEC0137457.1 Ger(x)C family spore germination protein [Paenibacillus macerans]